MLGRKLHSGTRASLPLTGFVLEVLLGNLRPSMCDFVSCDRIVQGPIVEMATNSGLDPSPLMSVMSSMAAIPRNFVGS